MPDVAVRSSTKASSASATSISVAKPTGTVTGDAVVAIVGSNNTPALADNNGATAFTEHVDWNDANAISGFALGVYSRRIQAGDPASFSFNTDPGGARCSAIAVTFSDPDGTSIFDVAPTTAAVVSDGAAASSVTTPSVTSTVANCIHCLVATGDQGGAILTPPSGYTEQQQSTDQTCSFSTKVIAAAGATGTATYSSNTLGIAAASFLIKNNTGGAGTTVTPPTKALTLATFVPSVLTPVLVAAAAATALTLSTFAPTVTASNHQLVTPSTAAITTSAFTPTVTTTAHQTVTPSTAAITLSSFAPTVTATGHQTVTPGTASVTLNTFAPTVTAVSGETVTPSTASLATSTFAPTVTTTAHQTVTPDVAALVLTSYAPSVSASGVQPASVYYQGDGKDTRKKKKRRRTDELFQAMERTLRSVLSGETQRVGEAAEQLDGEGVQALSPLDLSQGYDHALDQLFKTAGEYQDLSARVERLRSEIQAIEARKRQELIEDDEEIWSLM